MFDHKCKQAIRPRTEIPQGTSGAAGLLVAYMDVAYLRAAQAYELISNPTGTSTIFGVFHDISISLSVDDGF